MKEKSFLQMQAYDSIKNGILNGELEPVRKNRNFPNPYA